MVGAQLPHLTEIYGCVAKYKVHQLEKHHDWRVRGNKARFPLGEFVRAIAERKLNTAI
jgi:hypothetical protein